MKKKIILLASLAIIATTGAIYAYSSNGSKCNGSCCGTDKCEVACTCDNSCSGTGCECGCSCCK